MSHSLSVYSKGRKVLLGTTFLVSALLGAVGLSACGDGDSNTPGGGGGGTPVPRSGAVIFMRYCNTCHPGGGNGAGPSLMMKDYSAEEITATVRHGKSRMPGFGAGLINDQELPELISYVQGLKP